MFIVVLLLAFIVVYYFGVNRILGLPPGPPPLPLIGNMLSFDWEIDKMLLAWKAKYGRVFTVWMPFPMVVIGDHKVLQEHLVKDGDVFLGRKNPEQVMDITFGGLYGLGFEDNSMVKEQRKFALRSLHESGMGSVALEEIVHHFAEEIVARWRKTGDSAVDVTENIMRAVGNIVWYVIFGITLEFDNTVLVKYRQLQQDMLPYLGGPFIMFLETFPVLRKFEFLFGSPVSKLRAISTESNNYLKEAIATVEKSFNADDKPSCYIEAFLAESKKREEQGIEKGNYNYDQMVASAASLWGAGLETTVSIVRLCILELVNHPDAQRKLQKEIDEVIGKRRIRHADLKQLPYISAFVEEVFRVGNVLPINFLRQTMQDTEVDGWPIRAGTTILPQFSMVHSDPAEFERPDFFCPERHINEEGQFVKDPRITPFSVGKRSCLGETLAKMEIFVMLAAFVQNCNFVPVNKVPPAIEFVNTFGRAAAPFLVKIQPRN
ncbi:hypothetical protein PFISCL1PPCAC_13611 [Pristionchus fissidentatus]|uniref:Cytochrome P450 n=1 Tax=Pristionchus fissidentatus TaxID=1538716 RepID=A0AAV5VX64_9BILA|nr:hypothetical protein PFISCL1PPCAC_13611 [Pristionchus fissidentatus]